MRGRDEVMVGSPADWLAGPAPRGDGPGERALARWTPLAGLVIGLGMAAAGAALAVARGLAPELAVVALQAAVTAPPMARWMAERYGFARPVEWTLALAGLGGNVAAGAAFVALAAPVVGAAGALAGAPLAFVAASPVSWAPGCWPALSWRRAASPGEVWRTIGLVAGLAIAGDVVQALLWCG